MTDRQPIPNTLRRYRTQAGLRQLDVANLLGLQSTDRISHWENGETFPNVTNLFKLSAIYGVPPQELYVELFKSISNKVAPSNQPPHKLEY